MNKIIGMIVSISLVWAANAVAADLDQSKLKTGAAQVVPAVQKSTVQAGVTEPIGSKANALGDNSRAGFADIKAAFGDPELTDLDSSPRVHGSARMNTNEATSTGSSC